MIELEYPFDSRMLLRKRKSIKRQLLENIAYRTKKNIAILCGSTANDVVDMLELFLLNYGIEPSFYLSEYGKYWEDAVFDNQELDDFNPDIIYIHTTNRNIQKYPDVGTNDALAKEMRGIQFDHYKSMWESLDSKYSCPIIQNNFELPYDRVIGNADAYLKWGKTNYINRLNVLFSDYADSHRNFYINDINYLSADLGLGKWYDPFAWYMYKYAMSIDSIPFLAFSIANIIKSIYGKNKKALAIDLDNTLWGGVVGDDGVDNISIGKETSRGQMYTAFQDYLKQIKSYGYILNVISKNDEKNALEGLNHPEMVLHTDDFVQIRANWDTKSANLVNMASELSLGVDSFVFVDDNPAEREIIRQQISGVGLPILEKPEDYIRAIDRSGYFEVTSFSTDDASKTKMYQENNQRAQLQHIAGNYEEYLHSLEMKAEIKSFSPVYLERIAQLTNKSNQFNLTTRRFTQAEIEQISKSDEYITLYAKLADKFGDNGVVSVVIGKKNGEKLDIILWLMSCRVLKRNLEFAIMDELMRICREINITRVKGYYYPTQKNGMVRNFFDEQGFLKIEEDTIGNSVWEQCVSNYKNKNIHIVVEREER